MNLPFSHDVLYPSNSLPNNRSARKIQIGDVYRLVDRSAQEDETNLYLLAGVEWKQICLVSLDDGQRWDNPRVLQNSPSHFDISQEDLELAFSGENFEYVGHIANIVNESGTWDYNYY